MAERSINLKFKIRIDTGSKWASSSLILLVGEPGYDSTNKILKFGDGVNTWPNLSDTRDTAAQILAKLKTVDGTGSGLDADLFEGQEGSYYLNFNNITNKPNTLDGYGINNAVVANGAITAATKTKITYDTKGLVTAGADLAASDIPSLDWSKITSGKPTTRSGYGITDAQPLDADLTAIAALAGTSGLLKKTAADTWALDTNSYTVANNAITAATKAKITYDTKGLVTSGADLTASDIPNLPWSKITSGKPDNLEGYGILDAAPLSHVGATEMAHGVATSVVAGFMAASDKSKLDTIADYANNYVHPTSGVTAGTYKSVTVNSQGHVTAGTNPTNLDGDGSNLTSTFSQAATRANLVSGESHSTIFGKIMKWFADLGALAWKATVGTTEIAASAVTNAKMANMTAYTVKGRNASSSGAPSDVTMLDVAEYALFQGTTVASLIDTDYVSVPVSETSLKKITWANLKSGFMTANSPITGGTKTKISYDSKGLVIAGSDLSASDIPDLDWTKITTGKPTTLAGYGITDGGSSVEIVRW